MATGGCAAPIFKRDLLLFFQMMTIGYGFAAGAES